MRMITLAFFVLMIPGLGADDKKSEKKDEKKAPSALAGDVEVRVYKAILQAPEGRPATRKLSLEFDVENTGKKTVQIGKAKNALLNDVKLTTAGGLKSKSEGGTLGVNAPLSNVANGKTQFKPKDKGTIGFGPFVVEEEVQDFYTITMPGEYFGHDKPIEIKVTKDSLTTVANKK